MRTPSQTQLQIQRFFRRRPVKIGLMILINILPLLLIPQFIYDPLDLQGWNDAYQLQASFECATDDCLLYRLPIGDHTFRPFYSPKRWRVTVLPDGTRDVPANSPDCTVEIALVGDSYVWGVSMDDEQTWVNLLAERYPDACFRNYAQWGYNTEQAAAAVDRQVPASADYILYFIFQNDDLAPHNVAEPTRRPPIFITMRYLELIAWRMGYIENEDFGDPGERYPEAFADAINALGSDGRVRFIGYEPELLVHTVEEMGYTVFKIPVPPNGMQMSPIDDHPNEQGHQMMADSIAPLIEQILAGD